MRVDRTMLFALLLIGIGVLLLLQQADVLPEGVGIWPIVLIGVGVVLLVERLAAGGAGGAGLVVPLVVIAIGTGFLLEDAGVIEDDDVLLPLVAIAIGVGLVLGAVPARRPTGGREEVALAGAARASVEIDHGAGELLIRSHLAGENLLEGSFAGGIDVRERRDGERLEVTLRPTSWLGSAWGGRNTRDWSVTLTRTVPVELALRTGAGRVEADLSDLRVESLRLETGAGAVALTIPSIGRPQVHVRAGAADVRLTVPARMAARIEVRGGLSSIRVDPYRFPYDGATYRSPGYDEADDRADVVVEAGAANVVVA
jgi:hypothetical protein